MRGVLNNSKILVKSFDNNALDFDEENAVPMSKTFNSSFRTQKGHSINRTKLNESQRTHFKSLKDSSCEKEHKLSSIDIVEHPVVSQSTNSKFNSYDVNSPNIDHG